ncbi:MAG: hypothetical protein ACKN9T_07285 [Candidatus Methylumidiphilus sp.]
MNPALAKCLLVFSAFAVIGFGPVSPGCLIGIYVVFNRPAWFIELARELYTENGQRLYPPPPAPIDPARARRKCFLSLVGLFIVDILPVPVTPTVAFVILLSRPRWFYHLVETVYAPFGGETD